MSMWHCDEHGFTGPMACCPKAGRAVVEHNFSTTPRPTPAADAVPPAVSPPAEAGTPTTEPASSPLSAQDLAWMDEWAARCRTPYSEMSADEARKVTAFAAMWFVPALKEVHRLRAAIQNYADQRKRYPRSGAEIHAFGKLLATVDANGGEAIPHPAAHPAPSPGSGTTTNYVRRGRWSLCYHCGTMNTGEHYCAAPWQTSPEGPGIDDASPALIATMKAKALAALASRDAGLRTAAERVLTVATEAPPIWLPRKMILAIDALRAALPPSPDAARSPHTGGEG